jgi:uncharacterized protein
MIRIVHLISLVKSYYKTTDPAHDWAHVGRVAATAKKLCEGANVNPEVVLAGVYCHDLINLPKDHPDRKNASTLSAQEAGPLLRDAGFTHEEIETIKICIIQHSFSKGDKPSIPESAIVQDADRLDALGAIGILRCAAVNTQMKSAFYDALDPLAQNRELDDEKFMLDHYYVKLFSLPEKMNTPQGKSLAYKRVNFMKSFLEELMVEIK